MAKTKADPEQQELPGMETVKDAKIHRLAREYAKRRDARMKLQVDETGAYDLLEIAMKEKSLTIYAVDDVRVELNCTEKYKVKVGNSAKEANSNTVPPGDGDDEGEGEGDGTEE